MGKLTGLEPAAVFKYFEEITSIPHGSGDMEKISEYCVGFAKEHSLECVRDGANNVCIFKKGSKGKENAAPVILQGHLDMVCQKTAEREIDFENDPLSVFVDGGYIKAEGTTLGADNGIAVAMIMAILADENAVHPPIEAVFTTDEEIGMIGAGKLELSGLKGRRMINIDSEDPTVVTVSCAGGSDFRVRLPFVRTKADGQKVTLSIGGLKGGHSGVEIASHRANADLLLARILYQLGKKADFEIIAINGGDKGNAIPPVARAELVAKDAEALIGAAKELAEVIKAEIKASEADFELTAAAEAEGSFAIINPETKKALIATILCVPNGVQEMSAEIDSLVETSLNLGVLETEESCIKLRLALRSNKQSSLDFLEEKLMAYFSHIGCEIETGGHYPPWEYKAESEIRELYCAKFAEKTGSVPSVAAIHAGLECGIFASGIENFDCISIGPEMHDIHTVKERLSVDSTRIVYETVLEVLRELK